MAVHIALYGMYVCIYVLIFFPYACLVEGFPFSTSIVLFYALIRAVPATER